MPPKSPNCYAAENNPKGPYISTVLDVAMLALMS